MNLWRWLAKGTKDNVSEKGPFLRKIFWRCVAPAPDVLAALDTLARGQRMLAIMGFHRDQGAPQTSFIKSLNVYSIQVWPERKTNASISNSIVTVFVLVQCCRSAMGHENWLMRAASKYAVATGFSAASSTTILSNWSKLCRYPHISLWNRKTGSCVIPNLNVIGACLECKPWKQSMACFNTCPALAPSLGRWRKILMSFSIFEKTSAVRGKFLSSGSRKYWGTRLGLSSRPISCFSRVIAFLKGP